jgi:hypothetical protein
MKNITLTLDEDVFVRAQKYADDNGVSFDMMIRRFIEQQSQKPDKEQWLSETLSLLNGAHGNSYGESWTREELHAR